MSLPKTLNLEEARGLLPEHGTLFESATEQRMRGFWQKGAVRVSTSASLTRYSTTDALVWCLQFCWQQEVAHGGPVCNIQGLMEKKVARL